MKKISSFLNKMSFALAGTGFTAVIALIVFNVFARFLFKKSFAWVEELAYVCFTWSTFLGIAIVYKNRGLVAIDVLVNKFSEKGQHITAIVIEALLLVANVFLTIWSIDLCMKTTRITSMLRISYKWVYLGMIISFIILTYESAGFLISMLKGKEVKNAALEDQV